MTKLPKFVSVQFYPGYSYIVDKTTNFAAGRYVALGEDGIVYVYTLDGEAKWEVLLNKD